MYVLSWSRSLTSCPSLLLGHLCQSIIRWWFLYQESSPCYHVPALAGYARWKFVAGRCLSRRSRDYVPVNLIQDAPKAVFGFLSRLLKSWTLFRCQWSHQGVGLRGSFQAKAFHYSHLTLNSETSLQNLHKWHFFCFYSPNMLKINIVRVVWIHFHFHF